MKLAIKNLENIHGKCITDRWEIMTTKESKDDYYFELVNRGQFKHTTHGAWIERMKYGDGYRLHSSDYKGHVVERYLDDVSEAGVLTALNEMFDKLNKQ